MHTREPIAQDTPCFLCGIDRTVTFGRGKEPPAEPPEYVDISVTDQVPGELLANWEARLRADRCPVEFADEYGFHPLRFVTLRKGSALFPGYGTGYIALGDHNFKIVYAWGGRNLDESDGVAGQRWSYTVRLRSDGDDDLFNQRFHNYLALLYLGEGGWFEKEITAKQWLLRYGQSTSVASWREKLYAAKDRWWDADRDRLLKAGEDEFVSLCDETHTIEMIEDRVTKLEAKIASGDTITIDNRFAMLGMHIKEIKPESLFA